jgi:TonB-linked SusC/RagA family outer membrane protein
MMYKTTTLWLGKLGLGTALVCHCFGLAAQETGDLTQVLASVRIDDRPNLIKSSVQHIQNAQTNNLRGRVTDNKGEPLPGVGVKVKGTNIGAITDADGNYVLNVPEGTTTLEFTYMGFSTREVAYNAGQTSLNITLEENVSALEEVVVVGYGVQKKVNLTGAVAAVTFDEKLTSRTISNVSTALNGLLPGLAVNQSSGMAGNNNSALFIRGQGTISPGNSVPLIVVDGMPDVDINRINMHDIESVSVLKDATAASVYGSRAANGVILITTKTGAGKKPTITFSGNLSTQRPTNGIGFMADYPRSLMVHRNAQAMNAASNAGTYRYGTIEEWMAMGMVDPIRFANTDWFDVTMRDAVQQNYNLSASGGNDVSNFFISAGVLDETGLQLGNDFTRYNARVNYDYKIRKNIKVGAKVTGDWSNYTFGFNEGFTGGDTGNAYDLRFAVAGVTPYDPVTGYYGGRQAYGENTLVANPLALYDHLSSKRNQKQLNGVFNVEWEPIEGLKTRVDYSLNYSDQFTVNANMPIQAYDFQNQSFTGRWILGPTVPVSNQMTNSYKTMLNGRVSYNKTIAKNHEIGALAVYSEEYWNWRTLAGSRTGRVNPLLTELNTGTVDGQTNSGNSEEEGLRSFIGRLNYAAFNKYLVEVNARYDGSSKFYPGYEWGFFPSASIGWRFTEENFLSKLKEWGITSGKIRASYGGLGNNRVVPRYEQREVLTAFNYALGGSVLGGYSNNRMINRMLSWEKVDVLNLGLDLVMLNNRLSAEFDYYDRKTDGMIEALDISMLISGMYTAPRHNIGQMRNKGVEGNFTWTETRGDFQYRVNLNASYNRNRLENWGQLLLRNSTAGGNRAFIGMPLGFLYGYQDNGIAQNFQQIYENTPQGAVPGDLLLLDLNGDGRITDEDLKADPKTQTNMPNTNFALNSSVSYKGFDLNVQLQGAAGRKAYWLSNYNELNIGERYAASWDHWNNPWSVDNRNGIWPRLNSTAPYNRAQTNFWLDDLSYLRIRNVQLGYNLPKNLLRRINVNNFRVFVSGENLHTFTSYRGIDPESTASMNDVYPLLKSFSLGVNINL